MEKEQLVSLVTKAQQGDNEALNCLFNEFYNDLYYFALKTVKDDETALDVTQEAFVEIINTLGNLFYRHLIKVIHHNGRPLFF